MFPHEISSFNELLEKDNSFSIHHKNWQSLARERYEISNNISPTVLSYIFEPRSTPYNLCNPVGFKMWKVHSVCNCTENLSHLGPKIWGLVPQKIRQSVSLVHFKSIIKKWTPSNFGNF